MKIKRITALLTAAIMCITLLSGCKKNNTGVDDNFENWVEPSSVPNIFADDTAFGDDDEVGTGAGGTAGTWQDGQFVQTGGNVSRPTAGQNKDEGPVNTGDANLSGNTYLSGFPIVKDKITLKVMAYYRPGQETDWSKMEFSKRYEKKTNIKVEWKVVAQASLYDQVKVMLQTQSYPDILVTTNSMLLDSEVYSYGTQGVIWDMSQAMQQWAPNVYGIMKQDASVRVAVLQQNGSIYSLPYINGTYPGWPGHYWMINKKWLDKLNLKVPTTTSELQNVLLKFKNNDPDGDGKNNQTPILTFCHTPELFGPWGVYFDWGQTVMLDNTGKTQFVFTMNEMREAVLFWRNIRKQGAADFNWWERPATEMAQMINGGKVGIFLWADPSNRVKLDVLNNYVVMGVPKATSGVGSNLTPGVMRHSVSTGGKSTYIFNSCKNKNAALRWLDYFYSYEGNAFKTYLDTDYKYLKVNSQGGVYVDVPDGENTLLQTPGSVLPGIYDSYFSSGYFADNPNMTDVQKWSSNITKTARALYKTQVPKYTLPDLTFNTSEMKTIAKYKDYLNFETCWYVIRCMIDSKSDAGVYDPVSDWSTWVKTKKDGGLDELLKVYQNAYNRAVNR